MTATFDSTGLTIQSFGEALDEIVDALQTGLTLTDAQAFRVRNDVRSVLGNLARAVAESDIAQQETLLQVYNSLSWYAEGAALERVAALLGVTRRAATSSQVIGAATGTAATALPGGTRLRYNPTGSTWALIGGYVIGGGGTVEITIESESSDADEVALDPATGFDDWTILDSVPGWSDVGTFESTEQPVVGAPLETDAELRARAGVEAFRRAQGPLVAIEALVSAVSGVTFVRAWENTDDATDADGIPGRSINVVVEGGAAEDIAQAIRLSRPAGIYLHGTDVIEVVDLGAGRSLTVRFDRVADVALYIRATLTTSTSEVPAPADLETAATKALVDSGNEDAEIGADVLPRRLSASLDALDGFDAVVIELSDDGATWLPAGDKWPISIRQRASFAEGRVTIVED